MELASKFRTWKDFIETLAHEMVHLYQMQIQKDPYANHNKRFYFKNMCFDMAFTGADFINHI